MIINNNGGVAGNTHNKILFGVVGGPRHTYIHRILRQIIGYLVSGARVLS